MKIKIILNIILLFCSVSIFGNNPGFLHSTPILKNLNLITLSRAPFLTETLDHAAPIITLIGWSNFSINNNETYTDPGFTVTDNIDNNLAENVTISGTVYNSIPGTYTLTYDVTDTAGNPAIQKTRTVTVVDTVAPTITLLGDDPLLINQGGTYTEPGATAVDHPGISYTGSIVIAGSVNVNVAGTYFITYNVNDSAGNSATQKVRTVNVLDTEAPVITLAGT